MNNRLALAPGIVFVVVGLAMLCRQPHRTSTADAATAPTTRFDAGSCPEIQDGVYVVRGHHDKSVNGAYYSEFLHGGRLTWRNQSGCVLWWGRTRWVCSDKAGSSKRIHFSSKRGGSTPRVGDVWTDGVSLSVWCEQTQD